MLLPADSPSSLSCNGDTSVSGESRRAKCSVCTGALGGHSWRPSLQVARYRERVPKHHPLTGVFHAQLHTPTICLGYGKAPWQAVGKSVKPRTQALHKMCNFDCGTTHGSMLVGVLGNTHQVPGRAESFRIPKKKHTTKGLRTMS